jgi:hypothetical protein
MAGRDNVIELIFRAVNETGSVVTNILREQQRIGQAAQQAAQSQKASVATVAPEFDRLRATIIKLGEQYQKTGLAGRSSLTALAVAIKQVETAHGGAITAAARLGDAERKIYDSAKASLTDAIAKQREFNAIQSQLASQTRAVGAAQQQVTKQTQELGGAFAGVGRNIAGQLVGMAAGVASVSAAFGFLKSSFKEFLAAEAGIRALASSIEVIGGNVKELSAQAEVAIANFEKMSVFDDDELRAALTTLVTITGDFDASLKTVGDAMDLAAARGMTLSQASELLGRAIEGNIIGLSKMGIKFSEADKKVFEFGTELQRAAVLHERLTEAMGGRAQAQLGTHAAQIQILSNRYHDWKEEIGGAMAAFVDLVAKTQAGTPSIQEALFDVTTIARRPLDVHPAFGKAETPKAPAPGGKSDADAAREAALAEEKRKKALEESKKATDSAREAAKQYREEVERLAGVGAATAREQKQLAEAIAIIDRNTDITGAGAVHFADRLKKIGDEARETGGRINSDLIPALQRLYDLEQHPQIGAEFSAIGKALAQTATPVINQSGLDAAIKKMGDASKARDAATAESFKRAAEESGRIFIGRFEGPMTDIFTDLALTGGKNFGQIAGRMFADSVRDGAQSFVDLVSKGLTNVFGGGAVTEQNGKFFIGGEEVSAEQATAARQRQGQIGRIGGAVVGAASQFAGVVSQSGSQRQSALSTVASFTLAGASVGGIYGAIVGAIVGGVAALLAPPQGADYSYGRYGVRTGGQGFFESSPRGGRGGTGELQNISENAQRAAQAQVQAAFDATYHDFTRTLLRFPLEVLPRTFAQIGDILPQVGKEAGGDMGRAASGAFWKDFELWFRQGMPRELAEKFRPVFAEAFTGMGFTITRFNDIWEQLQLLDPAEARKLLDQWAQFSVELPKIFDYLELPFAGRGGLLDTAEREIGKTPAERLSESFDPIFRLVDTLADAPLEVQIQGWNEVNRLAGEVQQNVKDFMAELAEGIRSVTESFGASIRELEIAGIKTATGAPDYQGQAEYLKRYADDLRARIGSATSPQEAQALGEELRSTIGQIYGLGQQLGPAAGEEFRKWALQALTEGRDAVLEQLRELGDAVAEENRVFLEHLRGPWETFTGQATSAGDALDALTDAVGQFIGQLKDTLPDFSGGSGPPGSEVPGRRGGVPILLPEPDRPEAPWYTPPTSNPPLFGPGSGPPPVPPGRPVGAFGMTEITDRLASVERAIIATGARMAQILSGDIQGTTRAVLSTKGDINITNVIEGGRGPTASNAGPSTRRGR